VVQTPHVIGNIFRIELRSVCSAAFPPSPSAYLITMGRLSTIYKPLQSQKSEIRLLEIIDGDQLDQKGSSDQPIRCRLHTVSLEEKPASANCTVNKTLDSPLRHVWILWKTIPNTPDLSSFRLWVDAICINQAGQDMNEHHRSRK
jgi:hypothetical protein